MDHDDIYSILLSEDASDTIEFELPTAYHLNTKNISFIENDSENGILGHNITSCCFYKHSHNIAHDHFTLSRGIQCGNSLSKSVNSMKTNSEYSMIENSNCNSNKLSESSVKNVVYPGILKPKIPTDYSIPQKLPNIPKCPPLRNSEKFRNSQESILENTFTIENHFDKLNNLKDRKKIDETDYVNRCCGGDNDIDTTDNSNAKDSFCPPCKDEFPRKYLNRNVSKTIKFSDEITSGNCTNFTRNAEVPSSFRKTECSGRKFGNMKDIISTSDSSQNYFNYLELPEENISYNYEENEVLEIDSDKEFNDESEEIALSSGSSDKNLLPKSSKQRFSDNNNSNFHNESSQKSKQVLYLGEPITSRNNVRAKYCSEKSVKHKFFLSENANIELILRDSSDRRIKAICDKFNCDIDVYSKVIKSGYLKNIVVISAPNLEYLKKCVRSLDSNMNWCLTCQLVS